MSPIERAARKLCEIEDVDPESSLGGVGVNFLWMEYAETRVKPMLRAIREPSEAQLAVAKRLNPGVTNLIENWDDDHREMWQAMIDAALAG